MNSFEVQPTPAGGGVVRDDMRARDIMQALLFSEILKPLATALGPIGETVVDSVAQRVCVRPPL